MDLVAMRPSQWASLDGQLVSQEKQSEFLTALVEFLKSAVNDSGADTDRIYTTALKMTNSRVWNHIPVDQLVQALSSVPNQNATVFLGGLPSVVREQILLSITLANTRPRPSIVERAALHLRARERDKKIAAGDLTGLTDLEAADDDADEEVLFRSIFGDKESWLA